MDKNKNSLVFFDVIYKNIFKSISFSLPKGEDLVIYTSNPNVGSALRSLLVYKNNDYNGLIYLGDNLLTKKHSDFYLKDKALTVFADKNKNHYFKKLLFQVLKYSLKTNDFLLQLQQDFRKDWKEISDEYGHLIKEKEIDLTNEMLISQEDIYINFFSNIEIDKLNKNLTEILNSSQWEKYIEIYIEKRIEMLNESLNLLTDFELEKINHYFYYQEKFRNKEKTTLVLKEEYKKVEKQFRNLENTSEFAIAMQNKNESLKKLKIDLTNIDNSIKKGTLNKILFNHLKKSLWNKIKLAKKEIKKFKDISSRDQARLNYWIKWKTYKYFIENKKIILFLSEKDALKLYKELQEYETTIFSDIYFLITQEKRHFNLFKYSKILKKYFFNIDLYKKKSENQIKNLNEQKLEILEKIKIKKEEKINGSKKVSQILKNETQNSLWEKKAEYFWELKIQKEKMALQIKDFDKTRKILEKNLLNKIYEATKLDNLIFQHVKKVKIGNWKIIIEEKIQEINYLSQVANSVYKPSTYLYTKDLEENNHIFDILLKDAIYKFVKKEKIDVKKLWKPYDSLSEEERIKIDIAKVSLYRPKIVILDFNKTIFDKKYLKEIIKKKHPETSLIIISNEKINLSLNNYIFIEKGKIIEQNFKTKIQKFETKYAKEFIKTGKLNLNLISQITDFDFIELFKERKNIVLGVGKNIYSSHNELAVAKLESKFKEETLEFDENLSEEDYISIDDAIIIDLKAKQEKETKENGKNN